MTGEKTTREMIAETSRDVKWICRTLARMEETNAAFDARVRALEGWQSQKTGEELKMKSISAAIGAAAGGLAALALKLLLHRGG